MATQREIADRAQTSLKTVSRVINHDPLVNARTREKIEAIIAEIGYEPHQAARMMRSQRSNVIGFLADRVATTPSSIELIRGAQDVAWERGKQMMLFNIERDSPSQHLADAQLSAFRAEAVIYATRYHQPVALPVSAIPRILLNCFDPRGGSHAIVPDDYQLAQNLMEIVIGKGYKRPLFLNLPASIVAAKLRAEAIVETARKLGVDMNNRVRTAVVEQGGVARFVADTILGEFMAVRVSARPDVIICGQDILAMNVYFVLAELGLRVGEDVGVASFDNLDPIAGLLKPGLSTMELPYYEMGRAAMTAAISPPAGRQQTVRLPGSFVARGSL